MSGKTQQVNELAALAHNGSSEAVAELWAVVERLIKWWANRAMNSNKYRRRSFVDYDDLYQCGYIAMMEAIETYDINAGNFAAWLLYYYKMQIAEYSTGRSERQKKDPLHNASSLHAPSVRGDEDSAALIDTIADSSDDYEEAERRVYNQQLRKELDRQLETLKPQCADVIRRRYYNGETQQHIGEAIGVNTSRAGAVEREGLQLLSRRRELRRFIEDSTPYYMHIGRRNFNTTRTSAVERITLLRERLYLQAAGKSWGEREL